MTVAVTCTRCGASYSVAEKTLGRTAKCKKCGNRFTLASPATGADTFGATDTAGPPPGLAVVGDETVTLLDGLPPDK